LTRTEIAKFIAERLAEGQTELADFYGRQPVPYFVIDNLLPPELAKTIAGAFPDVSGLALKKSLRELKYVTAQMDRCQPILEETLFAFHDPKVVSLVADITGLTPAKSASPDSRTRSPLRAMRAAWPAPDPKASSSRSMNKTARSGIASRSPKESRF